MPLTFKKLIKPLEEYYRDWKINQREYNHLRNLLKSVKKKRILNKKIVFNTVRCVKSQLDREFFMGKLLAINGAKVYMLLDDGVLKHTESYQVDELPYIRKIYRFKFNPYPHFYVNSGHYMQTFINKINLKKALKTYSDENLKVIYYSKIFKKINYENWQELRKYAKASTIRFFKTSVLDFNNEYVKFYYKLSLLNAILSRNVAEYVFNEIKPDLYITSHGIYSTWGPAFQYLFDNGVNTLVYSSAHGHSMNPREWFFSDTRTYFLSKSKFWQKYKQNPVTEYMKKAMENYFRNRQSYFTVDTKMLYGGKTTSFKVDKNEGYKYYVALFPNVIWDGNITDRHKIFENYLDWIISTINHVKGRTDLKLYIKSHPSEVTLLKNSPKFVDIIKMKTTLSNVNNIVLIPPEKKINTYEFLKSGIDLGIVYDGFLAVEIPLLKIPTIICVKGGMFFVENGQLIPDSKEIYFNYLDNIDKTIEDFQSNFNERYDNLIKYTYWYIYENAIKLPILSKKEYIKTDLMQLKKEDLVLDKKFLKLIEN